MGQLSAVSELITRADVDTDNFSQQDVFDLLDYIDTLEEDKLAKGLHCGLFGAKTLICTLICQLSAPLCKSVGKAECSGRHPNPHCD